MREKMNVQNLSIQNTLPQPMGWSPQMKPRKFNLNRDKLINEPMTPMYLPTAFPQTPLTRVRKNTLSS